MNKLSASDTDSVEKISPLELGKGMEDCKFKFLPFVNADMSDVKLAEVLSTIESCIEEYGSNYSSLSDVRKAASLKHSKIQNKINQIKLIAAERSCTEIVSFSSELETKLEAYKIKWSLMNLKGSWNTDNFKGFDSFDFLKAASNLPSSNNQHRLILNLQQRMSILENKESVVQFPVNKSLFSNNDECSKENLISLSERITNMESQVSRHYRMMEELANIVQGHVDDFHSRIDELAACSKAVNDSFNVSLRGSSDLIMTESASFTDNSISESFQLLQNVITTSIPSNKIEEDILENCENPKNIEEDSMLEPESSFYSNPSSKELYLDVSKNCNSEQASAPDLMMTNSVNKDGSNSINDVQGNSLIQQSRALGKYLFPEPNDLMNKHMLKNVCSNIIPSVHRYCSDLQRALHEYMQLNHASEIIHKEVMKALSSAEKWTVSMLDLQNQILNNSFKPSLPKKVNDIVFPCLIQGHKHSIAHCKDFYNCSPNKRVRSRKSFNYKYCSVCLQSNSYCKFRKCSNLKFMPNILVCQECKYISSSSGKGCYSVLFCLNANHSKPTNTDILRALAYYVPNFDSLCLKAPVKLASRHSNVKIKNKQRQIQKGFRIQRPVKCLSTSTVCSFTSSKSLDCLLPDFPEQVHNCNSEFHHLKQRNNQIAGRVTNFWHNVTNNNMDKG